MNSRQHNERGIALVTVMMLLALMMTMLAGYFMLSQIEFSTTRSTMNSFKGLYAAEGGLNLRAELLRQAFMGYTLPGGTSPSDGTPAPCTGSNLGSSDFACITYALQDRDVTTYVLEGANNPMAITTPRGETYQNLNSRENQYVVYSQAENAAFTEAVLEMHFRSRLIPVFQFAAFFNKDLEILSSGNLNLDGPVHANGDIFLGTSGNMNMYQQMTAVGDIFRGPKSVDGCLAGPVAVADPDAQIALPACSGTRREYTPAELATWNDMIQEDLDQLVVPQPEDLDASAGHVYWDNADIRIVLDLNGGTPAIQVRNTANIAQIAASGILNGCGPATYSDTFFNNREGGAIDMLDVDLQGLLDCLHLNSNSLLGVGKGLDDTSDGGLVVYLGIDGPNMAGQNLYGARVRNGSELVSSVGGAPAIAGLSIVTNQAMYIQGHYNKDNKKPAAFISDSLNVLSTNWTDDTKSLDVLANRDADDTTIRAAFLTGTDTTGGSEGSAGRDLGQFGGGFLGLPRLHEDWTGEDLNYFGSFVSLNSPRHVDGAFVIGGWQFTVPDWNWNFEPDFVDVVLLPPLTPQFIYLRQELFVRQFGI